MWVSFVSCVVVLFHIGFVFIESRCFLFSFISWIYSPSVSVVFWQWEHWCFMFSVLCLLVYLGLSCFWLFCSCIILSLCFILLNSYSFYCNFTFFDCILKNILQCNYGRLKATFALSIHYKKSWNREREAICTLDVKLVLVCNVRINCEYRTFVFIQSLRVWVCVCICVRESFGFGSKSHRDAVIRAQLRDLSL